MPHIHDNIDFTVDIFIVNKKRVLLRMHDKYHHWLAVGGHIELDEDPNQAAIREAKEEVGLDITLHNSRTIKQPLQEGYIELIPPYFLNIHDISDTHKHLSHVFFATSQSDQVVEPNSHEKSKGWKWFTKEELRESTVLRENIKQYALQALEEFE